MKPVIFHSEAESELLQAIEHYEAERNGLGRELRLEVEALVERMRRNPREFPFHDRQVTRKAFVRRFPFTLFFTELEEALWIAAVAHQSRRPGYWKRRRPDSALPRARGGWSSGGGSRVRG